MNGRMIGAVAATAVLFATGSAFAGLIDHYMFEENGDDSAGPPFANGSMGSQVEFASGAPLASGSWAFSGSHVASSFRQITVAQADAFDPGAGDFSIAFWSYRNAGDTSSDDGVMDCFTGTSGWQAAYGGSGGAYNNKFKILLNDGSGNNILASNSTVGIGEWTHITVTVDRTNGLATLFLNGVYDADMDISGLTGMISPDSNLWIGRQNTATAAGLDGRLDDLRFYDHTLSQLEIDQLNGIPGPASLSLLALGFLGASRRRKA